MKQKEYIPLLYIILYNRLKEKAPDNTVDKAEFERCLSNHPFRFSKLLRPIILLDMKRYGLIYYKHGEGKIKLIPIIIKVDFESTSSMMHYAGCW